MSFAFSMAGERWAPVLGAPGYHVSDLGRIASTWGKGLSGMRPHVHPTGKLVKANWRESAGYIVSMYCPTHNKSKKKRTVHGLVAQAFLPEDGVITNRWLGFKDGDKKNCAVSNLFWMS